MASQGVIAAFQARVLSNKVLLIQPKDRKYLLVSQGSACSGRMHAEAPAAHAASKGSCPTCLLLNLGSESETPPCYCLQL